MDECENSRLDERQLLQLVPLRPLYFTTAFHWLRLSLKVVVALSSKPQISSAWLEVYTFGSFHVCTWVTLPALPCQLGTGDCWSMCVTELHLPCVQGSPPYFRR